MSVGGAFFLLLVDAVALHRLVRLVTLDKITQPVRERIIRWAYRKHDGPAVEAVPTGWQEAVEDDPWAPKLAVLITCRWCASVWLAAAVVFARYQFPEVWGYIALGLALSTLSTLIARMEE